MTAAPEWVLIVDPDPLLVMGGPPPGRWGGVFEVIAGPEVTLVDGDPLLVMGGPPPGGWGGVFEVLADEPEVMLGDEDSLVRGGPGFLGGTFLTVNPLGSVPGNLMLLMMTFVEGLKAFWSFLSGEF